MNDLYMELFKLLFSILLFSLAPQAFPQSNQLYIKAGTQIPFQHFLGSEYVVSERVGLPIQAGLITKPYEGYIKKLVAFFDDDPKLIAIIEDSYRSGYVFGAGLNYHFNHYYVGAYAQLITLKGSSAAVSALSSYYGIDFSFIEPFISSLDISIQSNLYNGGVLFGRRFMFKDPNFQVHLEFAISKNLGSRNNIQSEPDLDQFTFVQQVFKRVDTSMQKSYKQYVIIPSINIAVVYNLMHR